MTTNNFKDAQRRYLRIFFPVMALYVALCVAGPVLLATTDNPPRWMFAAIAILTSAPIAAVFWIMGRHLKETDEYTRKIQVDAMLVGGGITFSIATVWGFLELYHAVPRFEFFPSMMMVGPLFFATWGLAAAVQKLKSR